MALKTKEIKEEKKPSQLAELMATKKKLTKDKGKAYEKLRREFNDNISKSNSEFEQKLKIISNLISQETVKGVGSKIKKTLR